ncbi:MAG: mechanosensitive ion channel family protein, partial [Microgenomates group bacterium]
MTIEEIWQILVPILIFAGFLLGGYLIRVILGVYLTKLTRRTKTKLDDIILGAIKTPIVLIFLVIGANYALAHAPLPQDIIGQYLPTISYVIIVLIATVALVRVITGLLRHYEVIHPSTKGLTPILMRALNIIIYFIAFVLILHGLGIDVTALVAGLGIGGIAIAFALQETLSQFFAGMYLMTDKPIRIGDYIKLD